MLAKAFTPVPAPGSVEPEPSVGFDRVVQQAVVHAAVSSAKQVDSGSLLVFMLQEEESHAAFFLQNQGLDRLTLLRVISHGGKDQPVPAHPGDGEPDAPLHVAPLEAYATDLIARALNISTDTVKMHVRHILSKLSLSSRVEAAVFAVERRLAGPHTPSGN